MTLPSDFKVTTEMLWQGTLIFVILDAGFVPLLAWRINPVRLCQLRWAMVVTAGMFWGTLWAWVLSNFWDSVYSYIFLDWMRWLIPFAYGLLFAAVGLVMWWLALRFPGNPVVSFCLLGGLWGMITHVWAIYLGIVDKPPMLQGVAALAAVVVAMFEYVFYWCIILSMASVLQQGWGRLRGQAQQPVAGTEPSDEQGAGAV